MSHPHLSKALNQVVEYTMPYSDMQLGEILKITATDVVFKTQKTLTVQIIGFDSSEEKRLPVFRFIDCKVNLAGNDKSTPIRPHKGTIAGAGIACTHLPQMVWNMVGLGSIDIGRDYSFEYLDGREEFVYVCHIIRVERLPRPEKWREAKTVAQRYIRKVAHLRATLEKKRKAFDKRLLQAVEIKTANSVYRFDAAGQDGLRKMAKVGTGVLYTEVRIISANVGGSLVADVQINGRRQTMESSKIISIEFAS
ncbi:MAG: hypothetical protein WC766_00690 [Patescibacteria group bacterium]|jgi:hypothetical protein